jgi:hypothetical protein
VAKRSIRTVQVETGVLKRHIAQALEAAATQGRVLEIAGRSAHDVVAEASRYESAEELRERAWRLRGSARHALLVVAEIDSAAGTLEGLAVAQSYFEDAARDSERG